MYHVEIRQFPHNVCRFNLCERELLAIVVPWLREEWVEVGERKWNVNQAKLAIIEGPQLSMPQLAMGRGWRSAQRLGEDVTERVLRAITHAPAPGATAGARAADGRGGEPDVQAPPVSDMQLLADSLALEVLALLDEGPVSPQRVWRAAAERLRERPAAESLALCELAIRSLLARRLIVLEAVRAEARAGQEVRAAAEGQAPERAAEPHDRAAEAPDRGAEPLTADRAQTALRALDSWAGDGGSRPLRIRRA